MAALDFGKRIEVLLQFFVETLRGGAEFLQQRLHDAVFLPQERREQVFRFHLGLLQGFGQTLGGLHCLLSFDRKLVESNHIYLYRPPAFQSAIG